MRQAFIGIDVGTSSARAGIFDEKGSLLASARHPITVWHEAGGIVEQSSSEIWGACAAAVRTAMEEAELAPSAVRGVGFDATCSLVGLDPTGGPLTVSGSGDERRNVIVWMDHRAVAEAREVNDTRDDVLRYVGGSISPEMEIPKLLWLKRHLPSTYRSAGHFFDLSDYLSFRATRSTARSMCTLACKWNYLAHEQRWSRNYLERVGLGELASDSYAKIGNEIVPPGTPLGAGLTESAASDFGLRQGTPVGASLIDAHAGGVGTIGGHDRSETAVGGCRHGSRRRHRFNGAAIRSRALRACLWSGGCRGSLSIARRRQRHDGDQRWRRTKSAGPPDHGGYDRPDRRRPGNAGACPARRRHAGRGGSEVARINRGGHGCHVGDRSVERTDGAGNGRLPPDEATGPRTDEKTGSGKPRCDAPDRRDRRD